MGCLLRLVGSRQPVHFSGMRENPMPEISKVLTTVVYDEANYKRLCDALAPAQVIHCNMKDGQAIAQALQLPQGAETEVDSLRPCGPQQLGEARGF
jgi:hypothetical protein